LGLQLVKDKRCFVCGAENPHGLKVKVAYDGVDQVKAEFMAEDRYRGWSDYLHGGVLERQIKGLLDIKLCAKLEDGSVAAEGKGRMMIIDP